MAEITADLTAAAIILRSQETVALIDGVLMRRVFYDDFDRSVAQGLGGSWSWYEGDSWPSKDSNEALAYVDGTEKAAVLSTPIVGGGVYESYVGFPLPSTGDLFFDFWTGSAPYLIAAPTYGFTLHGDNYTGIYAYPTGAVNWEIATWTTGDSPFAFAPDSESWYRVHARWTDDGVLARVWKRGSPEPFLWESISSVGLALPDELWPPPFLDFYYSPPGPTAPMMVTNIEIWSTQASWPFYGGLFLDALLAEGPTGTRTRYATADSILHKTIDVAPSTAGSVDTFSDVQVNLFSHVPDSGPMWVSGSSYQGGVLVFSQKWWAYRNGYSEMETGQHDYDIEFDYYGYGQVQLYLRATEADAVVFTIGQTYPSGRYGYARIDEKVAGTLSGSTNRGGFTTARQYRIRVMLVGLDARLYIDGSLEFTYSVQHNLASTRLKLYNSAPAAGTVIDNWSFPYRSGTSLAADAVIFDGRTIVSGSFSAGAVLDPKPVPGTPDYPGGPGVPGGVDSKSTIIIRLNGVDITDDVIFSEAEFMSQASGSPGTCRFKLKDMDYAYSITIGQTLTLEIDGRNIWGGWVQSVKRQFFFPYTGSPLQTLRSSGPHADPCSGVVTSYGSSETITSVPRALVIEGVDYNILFNKRFVFDKNDPANGVLKSWPAGTPDATQIQWLCENYLDLSDDNIDYTTRVEHVGSPNPDARGNPTGVGLRWGDVMRAFARFTGAIWYITPDKQLVYTDVDTTNSGYRLTDTPSDKYDFGYRDMEILYNGSNLVNDAMVWGAGQGSKRVRFKRTRDSASIAEHGLWQVGDFRVDMWRQASVNKRSDSFVYGSPQNKRGGKDDAISIVVTLFKAAFRVAEKVDFSSDVFGYQDVIPIRRMRVTFPTTRDAKFELTLSHAIDAPWDIFEYWFPPLPKFRIVISVNDGYEYCPVPNLPDFGAFLGGTTPKFVSLFSDDFRRSGGQPDDGEFGWWTDGYGVPTDPVISNGGMTFSWYRYIYLANPVSGSFQIILAVDLTGWAANSSQQMFVYSLGNTLLFSLRANGEILSQSGEVVRISPSIFCGRKVFIRAVIYADSYSAVKVWPQAFAEPLRWSATGSGSAAAFTGVSIYSSHSVKITGITLFGDMNSEQFAENYFGPDVNDWYKTWPYYDPGDGSVLGWNWGTDTLTNQTQDNRTPSFSADIAWGYFDPGYVGAGANHSASQQIVSIRTNARAVYGGSGLVHHWGPQQTSPDQIRITGSLTLSLGRSKGIDNRGSYPGSSKVLLEFRANPVNEGDQPFFTPPDNPYWLVQTHEYMEFDIPWDTHVHSTFSMDVGLSAVSDQTGHLQWGVNVRNPFDVCKTMDPRGGPFMLPNWGGVSVTTGDIHYLPIWKTLDMLVGYFCLPDSSQGGTLDSKTCEAIPISTIQLNDMYRTSGGVWGVALQSPFKPGSVEMTVDGVPAKPALDFIESNPATGIIIMLNSFLGAKEIIVCYFPEDDLAPTPTPTLNSGAR